MDTSNWTVETVKNAARGLVPEVNRVLELRAIAEVMRKEMDEIQARVLQEEIFEDDEGNRITEPKHAWRIERPAHADYYYKRLDEEHTKAGFSLPPGHCPALIAEHEQMKAEHALIARAERYFPGLTKDALLCAPHGLENLKKYIDLLCGMVVNAPGFKPSNRFKKSA